MLIFTGYKLTDMERNFSRSSLKKRLSRSSLTNLFKKNGNSKRKFDDESDSSNISGSEANDSIEEQQIKRRRLESDKQKKEAFQAQEKKFDDALPADLRKYRPKGFPLNLPPKDRAIRIYADGVFDLFHLGHMKQLEQCKKSFPNVTLICGIPSDKVTHKLKGLTVLTDQQRCETLMHCKWVDEVIPDAPWCVTPEFLDEHKIDYVAHDDIPYESADSDDIYKPIKQMGKFLTTQRTNGISTSDIITKIIRDYDKYLMRNFARGATRQELNVSWLKKNELEFKKHIQDFRSYFKKNQENLNHSSRDLYFEVREILLKKTLGNNLYTKLIGSNSDSSTGRKSRKLITEASPASEFAHKFTGEKTIVLSSEEDEEDGDEDEDEYNSDNTTTNNNESDQSNDDYRNNNTKTSDDSA